MAFTASETEEQSAPDVEALGNKIAENQHYYIPECDEHAHIRTIIQPLFFGPGAQTLRECCAENDYDVIVKLPLRCRDRRAGRVNYLELRCRTMSRVHTMGPRWSYGGTADASRYRVT